MQLPLERTRLLACDRGAFGKLQRGVAGFSSKRIRSKLTLSLHPAFGSRWLRPKLADFEMEYPDIELHIRSSLAIPDSSRVDIAIRFGCGNWGNLRSDLLLDKHLFPVCSSRYKERLHPSDGSFGTLSIRFRSTSPTTLFCRWGTTTTLASTTSPVGFLVAGNWASNA